MGRRGVASDEEVDAWRDHIMQGLRGHGKESEFTLGSHLRVLSESVESSNYVLQRSMKSWQKSKMPSGTQTIMKNWQKEAKLHHE